MTVEREDREELRHNPQNGVTGGIWRVRRADGSAAVCKVLLPPGAVEVAAHWRASADPRHWNHWRREALAYATRLVDAWQEPMLDMPAQLDRRELADGSVELWLEDVPGLPGAEWSTAHHAAFAGALGRGQGRTAVTWRDGPALPDLGWLSRGFLRAYAESQPGVEAIWTDDAAWAHPLVAPHLGPLRERLAALYRERGRFYAVLDALPRTLCHLDVWPLNLVARPDGRVALLDWAFAGDGALGEDAGNLVPDTVFDRFLPGEMLPDLDRAVTDAYLAGVAEAGWKGDPRLVRLAICASAVKYHWLGPLSVRSAPGEQRDYGGAPTRDPVEKFRQRALGLAHLCRWADEARDLARTLGRW
jgi:hypothetical protein